MQSTGLLGSSPLTRGARGSRAREPVCVGIIPAHAGCTSAARSPRRRRPDHPRSRGVHSGTNPVCVSVQGSSPLTRGARPPPAGGGTEKGIIPAHAGCTRRLRGRRRPVADHPRSRGVHVSMMILVSWVMGSSPLTRGARAERPLEDRRPRIIPAHAGCTRPGTCPRWPPGDHPRSRGVHDLTRVA